MASLANNAFELDSRLTELLFEATQPNGESLTIHLPTLPAILSRFSAWAPSSDLRCLLYSLLYFLSPAANGNRVVIEERTEGQQVMTDVQSLLSTQENIQQAALLLGAVQQHVTNAAPSPFSWMPWWNLALDLTTRWSAANGEIAPGWATLGRVHNTTVTLHNDDEKTIAQINGVLLSLSMLNRLLQHFDPQATPDPDADDPFLVLEQLASELGNLPGPSVLTPPRLHVGQSGMDMLSTLMGQADVEASDEMDLD